jgi:hypothetical protein
MTGKPKLRLAAEYGNLTRLGALPAADRQPRFGLADYRAYEAANRQEEAVHMVRLVTWTSAAQCKSYTVPYSGISMQEHDDALYSFTCPGYAVTIAGRNLLDWRFIDALCKHRVKSILEWNSALHRPVRAGLICFTGIHVEKL